MRALVYVSEMYDPHEAHVHHGSGLSLPSTPLSAKLATLMIRMKESEGLAAMLLQRTSRAQYRLVIIMYTDIDLAMCVMLPATAVSLGMTTTGSGEAYE